MSRILELELEAWKHPAAIVREVTDVLRQHPGRDPLVLKARRSDQGTAIRLRFGDDLRVDGSDDRLRDELERLTGSRPSFAWDS